MDNRTKLLDDAMNSNFVKANSTLNNALGPRESMYLGCLWNHYKYLLNPHEEGFCLIENG